MTKSFIVYSPYPTKEEAKKAAMIAVEKNLACCVNIYDCHSVYVFEGEMAEHPEFVCYFKTLEHKLDNLRKYIEETHPYSVPAVITLEISQMNKKYFDWAKTELEC
ncbi:MAG: divalent-cation tolerance protein CutA [Caldiserica bacterium]|nr:divalent-cation tolerance protein CutA [Caldisericota bacterium]